jgi:ABC-type Mn2+/Zn2+ transport system ATPase subunit
MDSPVGFLRPERREPIQERNAMATHAESPDRTLIRAEDLELGYRGLPVLRSVCFEVRAGERWFIVGPNGQGKTTLLRGVLGLLPADPSRLWRHPEKMSARRIGFVPQRCELNPTLPTMVREFVLLGLVGLRVGRRERKIRLDHALHRVGLRDRVDSDYWALSGGQRQRALLARALIRRPDVLLLDEPTAGLDLSGRYTLMQELRDLNESEGITLLFVTHDVRLAAEHATHLALVHEGAVRADAREQILHPEILGPAYGMPPEAILNPEAWTGPPAESPEAATGQAGDAR